MLALVTPPAEEPVSLAEAKLFLRVDSVDEDTLIAALITSARTSAETVTGRALITQTWDYFLDAFPPWFLDVPLPPLQSVTSIKYIDGEGVEQTLPLTGYRVDVASAPARIEPAYTEVWPATRNLSNAVSVRFVAGYGGAESVPEGIKGWILMRISTLYAQREQFSEGQPIQAVPHPFFDGLLDPFRIVRFS